MECAAGAHVPSLVGARAQRAERQLGRYPLQIRWPCGAIPSIARRARKVQTRSNTARLSRHHDPHRLAQVSQGRRRWRAVSAARVASSKPISGLLGDSGREPAGFERRPAPVGSAPAANGSTISAAISHGRLDLVAAEAGDLAHVRSPSGLRTVSWPLNPPAAVKSLHDQGDGMLVHARFAQEGCPTAAPL